MSTRAMVINKEVYNEPIHLPNKRLRIELYLSPSDIPQNIMPIYDGKEDKLTISFQYIDSEKEKELINRDGIRLMVGIYSAKPIRIEVRDIKKEGINSVKLTNILSEGIGKLIDAKKSEYEGMRERANLSTAEEFLKINAGVLANHAAL